MSISSDSTSNQNARLDDWRRNIGSFVLNFGHLEYLVAVFLKDNLEHAECERYMERPFKDRIARIAKHLSENDNSLEMREEFARLIKRLDPVRALRNHIAHGYMCWHIAEQGGSPWVSIVMPKNVDMEHSAETQHLKFDDLRASLSDLDAVIAGFDRLVGFKP
jgi:hypothetical protein